MTCLRLHFASTLWLLALALVPARLATAQAGEPIRLRNAALLAELDRATGLVTRFSTVSGDRALTPVPGAGEAFRLILRGPDGALATVRGRGLAAPQWSVCGARATASWAGPQSDDTGRRHNIGVKVTYALDGAELRIWMSVENRTKHTVLEAWYPTLGGLEALGGEVTASNTITRRALKLPFGDFAPHYPGAMPMGFLDIGGEKGLYFGSHESLARLKLLRVMEQDGDISARLVHLPFTGPGARMNGCAAVFRFRDGGFDGSGRIYGAWFRRAFGVKDPKQDWLRRQSFFQMTMIMLPEGNIHYRYRDIPRLAADAKKYGLEAIQIAGWQKGGHDNGYPLYEPDPRLGTWEELRKAIAACHHMGVRVFFFVNLQPAMLDLDWYKRELHRYESETASGDPIWIAGWGMGTLASRMGLTTPLMAFLDPSFPRYADALMVYFRKLASIGADGVHVDKMFPQALNVNPNLTMSPDTCGWEGAIRFLTRMDRECRAIHPDWRISNECAWDRALQVGTATWWAGNMTAVKRVFPETAETVGLYQPFDYAGVNNAVRNGHVVMVAPYHFQRSMDAPGWQGLARYIRDVKRLRDRLADTVFLGESLGPGRAEVKANSGDVAHNVFRNPQTGRHVAVVQNIGASPMLVTLERFVGTASRMVQVHRPGLPAKQFALPASFCVDAERIAFVEELSPGAAITAAESETLPSQPDSAVRPFANADFESGTLEGWTADGNWTVDDNSAGGWYAGWQGRRFAWSGKGGEPTTGKLRSPVFELSADAVQVSVAGWSDIQGRTPDRWNYVTLNLEDGTEIARSYTANTTTFTPVLLEAGSHRGKRAYIEAVDNGTETTYSMICIDDVRLVNVAAAPTPVFPSDPIVLEDERYRVEVARTSGVISRIRDKLSGTEIITEPRLADNWRISLPIIPVRRREGWRNFEGNYIRGRDQRLTAHTLSAAGLDLIWKGPLRAEDGRLWPIQVRMRIAPDRQGLSFSLTVENGTRHELGEIAYPIIGGMMGLGATAAARKGTTLIVPAGGGVQSSRPFHTFNSMSWLGIFGPEQHYPYPTSLSMAWGALSGGSGGPTVYFGSHDPIARLKALHLEMVPGVSGVRADGNWPRSDELMGRPAGVRMAWVHFAYQPPGKAFDGPPVFVRCGADGIEGCARYYGEWLKRGSIKPRPLAPAWKPVGRTPFAALPALARDAARDGIRALLLTDWRGGNIDDGDPTLAPDPALGGDDGLRRAADECRRLGVTVYLECRINPVAQHTGAYGGLKSFVCEDRWGVPYSQLGWAAPRCTAEALSMGERRVWLNPGHPGYRAALTEAIERVAELGIAGVRLVGFFGQPLDFNAGLDTTPDSASWEGALRTLEAVTAAARRHRPDFALALDEPYDFLGFVPVHTGQPPQPGSPLATALPSSGR